MEHSEEHDSDKAFTIYGMRVPDKEGKLNGSVYVGYEGKVKVSLSKPKKVAGGDKWQMEFKTVLPVHVHEKLLGRVVERTRNNFKGNADSRDYQKMAKTVKAYSLESLVEKYNEVIDDYLWAMADERAPREKMLYVKWVARFGDEKSGWNGAKKGMVMSMSFNFFVGYFNGTTHFDIDFKAFHNTYDKEISSYARIPWTQERENFFGKIYANFEALKCQLDSFFKSLDDKTIDAHMANFKLLGSPA